MAHLTATELRLINRLINWEGSEATLTLPPSLMQRLLLSANPSNGKRLASFLASGSLNPLQGNKNRMGSKGH